MFEHLLKVFLAIFVVMDALGSIPIFLHFMNRCSAKKRANCSRETVLIAGVVLFVFLVFGLSILSYFNIDMQSFKIAGGLILLILGLKFVLGLRIVEERAKSYQNAVVPLATPIITGPGVITTVILMTSQYGMLVTAIASIANLLITYLILRNTHILFKILGKQGSDVLSRMMGMVLAAIAISFIRQGWLVP